MVVFLSPTNKTEKGGRSFDRADSLKTVDSDCAFPMAWALGDNRVGILRWPNLLALSKGDGQEMCALMSAERLMAVYTLITQTGSSLSQQTFRIKYFLECLQHSKLLSGSK